MDPPPPDPPEDSHSVKTQMSSMLLSTFVVPVVLDHSNFRRKSLAVTPVKEALYPNVACTVASLVIVNGIHVLPLLIEYQATRLTFVPSLLRKDTLVTVSDLDKRFSERMYGSFVVFLAILQITCALPERGEPLVTASAYISSHLTPDTV